MNPWEKVMEELVPDPVARKQLQQALRKQVLSSSLKSGIQEPVKNSGTHCPVLSE
jgi:hypothetical protein